jgi:hypothetical protein
VNDVAERLDRFAAIRFQTRQVELPNGGGNALQGCGRWRLCAPYELHVIVAREAHPDEYLIRVCQDYPPALNQDE